MSEETTKVTEVDKTGKAALEAEATYVDRREFKYRDVTYVVEGKVEEWDLEAMRAYEESRYVSFTENLLGPKQWARFMRTRPKNKDFAALTEALFETIGIDEGE